MKNNIQYTKSVQDKIIRMDYMLQTLAKLGIIDDTEAWLYMLVYTRKLVIPGEIV